MIAVDTNILVYAHRRDSEWHEKAYRLLPKGPLPGRFHGLAFTNFWRW